MQRILNPASPPQYSPPEYVVRCIHRFARTSSSVVALGGPIAESHCGWGGGAKMFPPPAKRGGKPSFWRGGAGRGRRVADRHARRSAGRKRTSCTLTTGGPSTWRDA